MNRGPDAKIRMNLGNRWIDQARQEGQNQQSQNVNGEIYQKVHNSDSASMNQKESSAGSIAEEAMHQSWNSPHARSSRR
jgi:hypothetical protein